MEHGENQKSSPDMKHFEESIHLIYKEMYRFVYSILHNREMTEDALQNAAEKIFRCQGMLKVPARFKAWAFTIARNEAITLIRRSRRDMPWDAAMLTELEASEAERPEAMTLQNEVQQAVLDIVNEMRPEYRQLILLRYYSELSLEEIARATGAGINTVKTRHMRAKAVLKQTLEARGIWQADPDGCAVEGERTHGT